MTTAAAFQNIIVSGYNIPLIIAASLSAVASLLHVGIIFGGAPWYRYFGAGERMAAAATAGRYYPTVVTSVIAFVLALWAAYALSCAGVFRALPLNMLVLCIITSVYLFRGLIVIPLFMFKRVRATQFVIWSSVICFTIGAVHLLGLSQVWQRCE